MGACLAIDLACCFTGVACKCLFSICQCSPSTSTKISYALLFFFNCVVSWIMLSRWAISNIFPPNWDIPECPKCFGTLAVYRLSFASFLFHTTLSILTIRFRVYSNKVRSSIQNGFWFFKILVFGLLVFITFKMPDSFFLNYGPFAMIMSAIFITIQLVLLIDFAYRWCEKCLEEYETTDGILFFCLIKKKCG
jgi:hypothetical protein